MKKVRDTALGFPQCGTVQVAIRAAVLRKHRQQQHARLFRPLTASEGGNASHAHMFSTMAMMSSFADPHFSPAIRQSPSPYVTPAAPAAAAAGGIMHESVMIASRSSGRRWHVMDQVGECLFGEVLRAMDIVHGGYYAIKVRSESVRACWCALDS